MILDRNDQTAPCQRGDTSCGSAHEWPPCGHGLDENHRERLATRGESDQPCLSNELLNLIGADRTANVQALRGCETQLCRGAYNDACRLWPAKCNRLPGLLQNIGPLPPTHLSGE